MAASSLLALLDDIATVLDDVGLTADADRKVSDLYDLIHPNASDTLTVRSLFVIDPNKKILDMKKAVEDPAFVKLLLLAREHRLVDEIVGELGADQVPRQLVELVALGRLDRENVENMVTQVTSGRAVPTEVMKQIVAKTDGVPLFVEELTKAILESGELQDAGDGPGRAASLAGRMTALAAERVSSGAPRL